MCTCSTLEPGQVQSSSPSALQELLHQTSHCLRHTFHIGTGSIHVETTVTRSVFRQLLNSNLVKMLQL